MLSQIISSREAKCWDVQVWRDFWNQLNFISYQLKMRMKKMYRVRFNLREDTEKIMILSSFSASGGIP